MAIEDDYLAVLKTTQAMLAAVNSQDWDGLAELEQQRAAQVLALAPIARISPPLDPALARRIVGIIGTIEDEDGEILEHVQVWQKHVRILLRLDKPQVV